MIERRLLFLRKRITVCCSKCSLVVHYTFIFTAGPRGRESQLVNQSARLVKHCTFFFTTFHLSLPDLNEEVHGLSVKVHAWSFISRFSLPHSVCPCRTYRRGSQPVGQRACLVKHYTFFFTTFHPSLQDLMEENHSLLIKVYSGQMLCIYLYCILSNLAGPRGGDSQPVSQNAHWSYITYCIPSTLQDLEEKKSQPISQSERWSYITYCIPSILSGPRGGDSQPVSQSTDWSPVYIILNRCSILEEENYSLTVNIHAGKMLHIYLYCIPSILAGPRGRESQPVGQSAGPSATAAGHPCRPRVRVQGSSHSSGGAGVQDHGLIRTPRADHSLHPQGVSQLALVHRLEKGKLFIRNATTFNQRVDAEHRFRQVNSVSGRL